MKKVILSLVMMLSLMSFTKIGNIQNTEELFSPECFEYADTWTSWKNDCIAFANDLAEFDYW